MADNAKDYYRNYVADGKIYPLNRKLVQVIRSFNPKYVFEFGCGVGKNLELLEPYVRDSLGIDISEKAVEIARTKRNQNARVGDESMLSMIISHDVAFTCSVLDHIEDVYMIIKQLKRIGEKGVVLAETKDEVADYYYRHDYEVFGFDKIPDYSYVGQDGATYEMWVWRAHPQLLGYRECP